MKFSILLPNMFWIVLGKSRTPYSMARSVCSSMSTLAMVTRPFCLAMAFSSRGPRILHGPHHLQHKHTVESADSASLQTLPKKTTSNQTLYTIIYFQTNVTESHCCELWATTTRLSEGDLSSADVISEQTQICQRVVKHTTLSI